MELVREYGPMMRSRTPVSNRFIASGLPMIDDLCDDEQFDKLVGDGQKAVRAFGRSSGLFTSSAPTRSQLGEGAQYLAAQLDRAGDAGLRADDERHRRRS